MEDHLKVPRSRPFVRLVIAKSYMKQSMEHWWNDVDTVKQTYHKKNLSHVHFAYQISHID
jgi:hypothetical protein